MQPVRVDRIANALGDSLAVTRPAHPSLRPHVRGYAGYHEHTTFRRRLEAPNGGVTMIVDLGFGLSVLDPARPEHLPATLGDFIAGPYDHACIVDSGGRQIGVQIDLTLLGARLLLDRPLREIANRTVTFEDLFGRAGRRLVDRLREAATWEERFALLDAEFGARLAVARPAPPDVEWAWRSMLGGRPSITGLADDLGCSRKYLTDRFSAQLGLGPKTAAGILRFRRALTGLQRGEPIRLADLAAATGYYDQAHLNRDFRRFAGITPTEFRLRYTPEFGLRAD